MHERKNLAYSVRMGVRDKSLLGPAALLFGVGWWAMSEFFSWLIHPAVLGLIGFSLLLAGAVLTAAAYLPESAIQATPLRRVRRWLKPSERAMPDDPEKKVVINQNVGPQGTGYAAGTMNFYGKQQTEMTDASMQQIYAAVKDWSEVPIVPVGMSQRTMTAIGKLSEFLRANGKTVALRGGIGQVIPPLQSNVEMRRDSNGSPYPPEGPALWINMDV